MDARRLVFGVGDRVTGWGRMVADADGVWLDPARVIPLGTAEDSRPRSRQSVRLVGADDVRAHLMQHRQDWTVETVGEDIDEHAQACVEVELLRVTGDLAQWAETLPDDLLLLVPSLIPLAIARRSRIE